MSWRGFRYGGQHLLRLRAGGATAVLTPLFGSDPAQCGKRETVHDKKLRLEAEGDVKKRRTQVTLVRIQIIYFFFQWSWTLASEVTNAAHPALAGPQQSQCFGWAARGTGGAAPGSGAGVPGSGAGVPGAAAAVPAPMPAAPPRAVSTPVEAAAASGDTHAPRRVSAAGFTPSPDADMPGGVAGPFRGTVGSAGPAAGSVVRLRLQPVAKCPLHDTKRRKKRLCKKTPILFQRV